MKKTIVLISVAVFGMLLLLFSLYFSLYNRAGERVLLKTLCKGSAKCFEGAVEDVIDGDTLKVNGETIRLALINTPEKCEDDYDEAVDFLWDTCPIGRHVIVDEDDMQISRSHRRVVGVVYCETKGRYRNLNEELLEAGYADILVDFCERSEFGDEEWAKLYGCC
jgi:micrococcal nuclease